MRVQALDLYVLEVRPARLTETPRMAQVVEFEAHGVVEILFEADAADRDHAMSAPMKVNMGAPPGPARQPPLPGGLPVQYRNTVLCVHDTGDVVMLKSSVIPVVSDLG